MGKFPEAMVRLYTNKFVCRRCKTVMHAPNRKILEGVVKCRNCAGRAFKPKRKK